MTRTPTAEEVLAKYREWQEAESQWSDSEDERFNLATAAMVARDSFEYAYDQWQAAQGPVTREWFVERFGTNNVKTRAGLGIKHSGSSVPWVYFTDIEGDTRFNQPIVNPTRSKIEALVAMLGGTDAS